MIKAKIKKKLCAYLLNLCVKHSFFSFFFLCDNLLLQRCVQSLCENTIILCVYLIDPILYKLNLYFFVKNVKIEKEINFKI